MSNRERMIAESVWQNVPATVRRLDDNKDNEWFYKGIGGIRCNDCGTQTTGFWYMFGKVLIPPRDRYCDAVWVCESCTQRRFNGLPPPPAPRVASHE